MEKLTGSEREKKEAVIKSTLGSLFLGEASYPQMRRVHSTYTQEPFTAGSDTVGVSRLVAFTLFVTLTIPLRRCHRCLASFFPSSFPHMSRNERKQNSTL
jgi:hypothetical protein